MIDIPTDNSIRYLLTCRKYNAYSNLFVIYCYQIHSLYRGTGASFQKAQSEFTTGVLRNENVRNAGASMAAGAAQSAMSSAATDNRYWKT